MNNLIEEIYKTRIVKDSEGNTLSPFPSGIPFSTGMILYNLIRKTKPDKILEVGMAYGFSTLFICQAIHDNRIGKHTAIDPLERTLYKSIGLLNVKKAGFESFLKFYEAPSYKVLPELLKNGEKFDFVFIDGGHLFDVAFIDFFYADKLLNTGKYLFIDDLWMPSLKKLSAYIVRNRKYEIAHEHFGNAGSFYKQFRRLVRNVAKFPLFSYYTGLMRWNYCILKKVSDEKMPWNFYKSF